MKLQKFLLKAFDDKAPEPLIHLTVPDGSIFQKAIILHNGINLIYAVPEIQVISTRIDTYVIPEPDQSIPDEAIFVDILDGIFEIPNSGGGQGVILFSIYKIK